MFETYTQGKFDGDRYIAHFMDYVRYLDVFDNEYIRTFCLGFSPMTGKFYAIGGSAYDYRKKTKSGGQIAS